MFVDRDLLMDSKDRHELDKDMNELSLQQACFTLSQHTSVCKEKTTTGGKQPGSRLEESRRGMLTTREKE